MKRISMLITGLFLAVCLLAQEAGGFEDFHQPDLGYSQADFLAPVSPKAAWLLDWGLNLSPSLVYDGSGGSQLLAGALSGQLWFRLSLPGSSLLYLRLKDSLLYTILPETSGGLPVENLWDVEQAYFQASLLDAGFTFSLGRRSYSLGSGLLLSGLGDGVDFLLNTQIAQLKIFGFYSGFLRDDFPAYAMGGTAAQAGRYFAGYSLGASLLGQEMSLLGLYQTDTDSPADEQYTSWHGGVQVNGQLFQGNYFLEAFYQGGYSPFTTGSRTIQAFGGTARYRKLFATPTSPSLSLMYALASGDPDRSSSQGPAGNSAGKDLAFQTFGSLPAASAFRPWFSNLQVFHLGLGLRPLASSFTRLRHTQLDLRYFYYAKLRTEGVINTGDAGQASFDLGHGLDLTLRWDPFNDLGLFVNAGIFLPGQAFGSERDPRYTIAGGLTLAF